jgi:cytochrome c biogenesis protein CcdA
METLLNHLSQSLTENPFLAYLGVFIGGVFSSSSPCVLATIPLVIGYVGGYSEGDRRKAILYSLTFILGLSLTFTLLGAIASLVGGLFGVISRAWYFVVGGIVVVIGLHLIGLFNWNFSVPVHLLWCGFLSLCHSRTRPYLDVRCLQRRGCLWDFFIVCIRPWALRSHLCCRDSSRIC